MMESACVSTSKLTISDDFRNQLFYPCLERMIQELTHRFSDVGELMSGIHACIPTSVRTLSKALLSTIIYN